MVPAAGVSFWLGVDLPRVGFILVVASIASFAAAPTMSVPISVIALWMFSLLLLVLSLVGFSPIVACWIASVTVVGS